MNQKVVAISGSVSRTSKTVRLLDAVLADLSSKGFDSHHVRLREIDAEALLSGDTAHPAVQTLVELVGAADGVIVGTPIYKASFSGLLKAGLDVLPQSAFEGKAVLPLGTGGSLAHVLALDYGLRPVLQSMAPRHTAPSFFVLENQLQNPDMDLADPAFSGLRRTIDNFIDAMAIRAQTTTKVPWQRVARSAGHPAIQPLNPEADKKVSVQSSPRLVDASRCVA